MTENHRSEKHVGALAFMVVAALNVLACSSPEPAKSDSPAGPGPSGAKCPDPAPTYDDFAEDFFESYCVRCHSSSVEGSARHGAPKSTNLDTLDGVRSASLSMLDQLAAAGPLQQNTFMPPDDESTPTRAERESLGEWLACGLP